MLVGGSGPGPARIEGAYGKGGQGGATRPARQGACAPRGGASHGARPRTGGRVRSAELEEEEGRLVYSFDIAVKGKPGIEEVQVDALTGEVASVEHEDETTEAREKQQEHEEKRPSR
ncbi:PepSY domain-containing protein [Cystobacter fuscus]